MVIVRARQAGEEMFLTTSDKLKISYDFYPVAKPKGYLAFIHMMPATKESWRDFAAAAQKAGYSSIAIDLRGHGQSAGGPSGFKNFSDSDHQKSILDVQAAVDFLKTQGATTDKISLIGASIGANLSLWYLADHLDFKKAALLSAGLNYRGLETPPLVKKLRLDQKVLAVSARDDDGNAADNEKLFGPSAPNLLIYETGGHGTNLLTARPDLAEEIINFLNEQ